MSVSTRKKPVRSMGGTRQQAGSANGRSMPLAYQAQQAAQQAGPFARNAASGAIAKTTPAVDAARSWAAPQLEQYARTISETLAPMISSALIAAARKIEAPDRAAARTAGRRRNQIAGGILATAAAGAATAVALRLRHQPDSFSAAVADDSDQFGPVTYVEEEIIEPEPGPAASQVGQGRYEGGEGDVNGHRIV